jgi:hypothetical protein
MIGRLMLEAKQLGSFLVFMLEDVEEVDEVYI